MMRLLGGVPAAVLALVVSATGLFSIAALGAVAPDAGPIAAAEQRWQPINDGLFGDTVVDVVFVGEIARANRSMLFLSSARGAGRGVFSLETDGSWKPVDIHPEGERRRIKALVPALDDNTNKIIYAGLEGQPLFARSEDRGQVWTTVAGPDGPRRFDIIAGTRGGSVYAGERGTGSFWTSSDRGDSWNGYPGPDSMSTIDDIFPAPDITDTFLISGGTLYRSANDPTIWTPVLGPSTDPQATVEMAAAGRSQWLYAIVRLGTEMTLLSSDDAGTTWPYGGWPNGVPRLPYAVTAGEIDLTQPAVWVGVADGRVFRSLNAGGIWSLVEDLPAPPTTIVHDEETNDVWSGSDGLGLFRISPELVHTGAVPVQALAVAAPTYADDELVLLNSRVSLERRDRYLRLLPELNGIFASLGGDPWTRVSITAGLGTNLLASPAYEYDDRLYSGQMRSHDGGATWRLFGEAPGGGIPHVMAVGPISGTHPVLYGLLEPYVDEMAGGGGLHMSADGGDSWATTEAPGQGLVSIAISPDFINDLTVYAANYKGLIYRTIDAVTFLQVGRIPTLDPLRNLYDMALSPEFASDRTVVVTMEDASDNQRAHVYMSTTAGEGTWQDRSNGLNHKSRPRRLILSPSFGMDGVAFVGAAVRSSDPDVPLIYASQGDTWFGEHWYRPQAGRTESVLDFAWGGSLADGALFATLGDLGVLVRTLAGVPVPPPTPTASVSPTALASPTMTSTEEPSATPTSPDDTATATIESPTDTPTATHSAPVLTSTTTPTVPGPTPTFTPTSTATSIAGVTPTESWPAARNYLPFAANQRH